MPLLCWLFPSSLSISTSLLVLLLYLLFLSVRPSSWPRKVAMETEADLMQRREMNYTVGEAVFVYKCVHVRTLAWFRAEDRCFGGFHMLWLAVIFLIEYGSEYMWTHLRVILCACGSMGFFGFFWLVHNLIWHRVLFLAQLQLHVGFLHLCAAVVCLYRRLCSLL